MFGILCCYFGSLSWALRMLGKSPATAFAVLGKLNFQINFRLFVILTIRNADCGLVSGGLALKFYLNVMPAHRGQFLRIHFLQIEYCDN